ncbi:hypothetical protein GCM10027055_28830 [Janibacter alkaliphilus]
MGSLVVGSLVVGSLVVGSLVVGSLVVGSLVVGSLVVGSLVVGSGSIGSVVGLEVPFGSWRSPVARSPLLVQLLSLGAGGCGVGLVVRGREAEVSCRVLLEVLEGP